MNIKVAVMLIFAIAYGLGFFMGKTYETVPGSVSNTPKQEVNFKTQEIGTVGPCKTYLIAAAINLPDHGAFTVICPSEYNIAASRMY